MSDPKDIVDKTFRMGQMASCITDHGVMFSIYDHYTYAKSIGQKPIIGFEAYVVGDHSVRTNEGENARCHLLLLAKNKKGYQSLSYWCSMGCTDGFYYKPRIDEKIMESTGGEGVVATSACFLKDSAVLTINGVENIQDVKENELVLTHNGNYKKVLKTFKTDYIGEIYNIKSRGSVFPIDCTKDHKFYIIPREQLTTEKTKYEVDDSVIEKIDFTKLNKSYEGKINAKDNLKHRRNLIKSNFRKYEPQWVEAKDLRVGDYLLTPIDTKIENVEKLDISFVDYKSHKCIANQKKLKSYNIDITNDFLEMLGWYAAEGSCDKGEKGSRFAFTMNIDEMKYAKKIKKTIFDTFGIETDIFTKNNTLRVCGNSIEMVRFFKKYCGVGCYNKKMPDFIRFLPPEKQLYFAKGAILGDGHLSIKNDNYLDGINFCVTSKKLANDINFILNRNLVSTKVYYHESRVKNDGILRHECFTICISNDVAPEFVDFIWFDKDFKQTDIMYLKKYNLPVVINGITYIKSKITELNSKKENTTVYCLKVEDDESFVLNNCAVHNCLGGLIPQLLLRGKYEQAKQKALQYKNFFEDFYLEIQPTLEPLQPQLNKEILRLSNDTGIPLVATTDSHYTNREDSKTHEILLAMQTQKKLSDPNRWKFTGDTYFVASRKEMEEMFDHPMHKDFPKDKLKEALDNTVIIAEMCNFDLEVGKVYLPEVQIPINDEEFIEYNNKVGGNINQNYLRYLCEKRLKEIGLYGKKEYMDRLNMEIEVINSMNFTDYFLIYYDICDYCRKAHIPVGQPWASILRN